MTLSSTVVDFEEIGRYESGLQSFLDGDMDADRFMAFRLQHGIYGQRQPGLHMVRIKLAGGKITPSQLDVIADLVEQYSQHDKADITPRQDIQLHNIPVANTGKVMRQLGEAGLTTREACGNTVRNITKCHLAGVCPKEHVDIEPFVQSSLRRFLRNPLTQAMPRKFKFSFSGCEQDCAQGMINDVGIIATWKNNRPGFRVLAGGGLGHKPRRAIVLEEFIEENELLPVIEAVISLHNRYSDRKRRARSRLKFLVERFGETGFLEKYNEELSRTRVAFKNEATPSGTWSRLVNDSAPIPLVNLREVMEQKQADNFVFPVSVPLGELNIAKLRGIARHTSELNIMDIRCTQEQNLLLLNVSGNDVDQLHSQLELLDLGAPESGDNIVSCPGTLTCRLGITASKSAAPKLNGGNSDLRLRISGCHNGCAQPETGDIGIYGEGKRIHGRLVPHYQIYFGGNGCGDGALGIKGSTIPVMLIGTAVRRMEQTYQREREQDESFFTWSRRMGADFFASLLSDLKEVNLTDMDFLARDHGESEQFRVEQFGGGECAGADQGVVAANFAEAAHERNYRIAFTLQRKYEEAIECSTQMLRLLGGSLQFLADQPQLDELPEIISGLQNGPPQISALCGELTDILNGLELMQSDSFDETLFNRLAERMDGWMWKVGDVCQQLDPQLDLAATLPMPVGHK